MNCTNEETVTVVIRRVFETQSFKSSLRSSPPTFLVNMNFHNGKTIRNEPSGWFLCWLLSLRMV
jgi:hypothetical protein